MEHQITIALLGVIIGGIGALIMVLTLGQKLVAKDDLRHAVKEFREEMRNGFKLLDEKIETLDSRLYNHINDYNSHNVAPRVPLQPYGDEV